MKLEIRFLVKFIRIGFWGLGIGLVFLLNGCGVYIAFPGKTVWFAYPPDSAVVPPQFSVIVGGVKNSPGIGYEAFGGDVAYRFQGYRLSPVSVEVSVDGQLVGRYRDAYLHRVSLQLPSGEHEITAQTGPFFNKRRAQLHVTVVDSFPFPWIPAKSSPVFRDTLWHNFPAKKYQLAEGQVVTYTTTSHLVLIFLSHHQVAWMDSVKGYSPFSSVAFQNGLWVPVVAFNGQLTLYWVSRAGIHPRVTLEYSSLCLFPVTCRKGFALIVPSGKGAGIYRFTHQGQLLYDPPPTASNNAVHIIPSAYCDDGEVRPLWVEEYVNKGKLQKVKIRTPHRHFDVPLQWSQQSPHFPLLHLNGHWFIDGGRMVYWWWNNQWRPLYVPVEEVNVWNNSECQPPLLGLNIIGFLPLPMVNWKLRCPTLNDFHIEGERFVAPDGKYYHLVPRRMHTSKINEIGE